MNHVAAPRISALKHGVTTGSTLFALAVIGYLGHHTGWSFSGGSHAHASSPKHAVGKTEHPVSAPVAPPAKSDPAGAAAVEPPSPTEHSARISSIAGRVEFPSAEAVEKSGVTVVPLETRSVTEFIPANAVVTYDERHLSRISTKVAGTVRSVHKRWGDSVQKGDVLAVIESVQIGDAKAEFLNSLASSETRAQTLSLLKDASESLPASRIREAELQSREANIRLRNAEQTLINLGIPARAKDFATLSDEQRAEKLHLLGFPDAMQSTLDRETASSNLVPIFAPFDGVVIGRDAGIGEWTEPSGKLFEVADVRNMWLKLDVQKEYASKVQLGQIVGFQADGLDEEIRCKVSWISTEVNPLTRTLQVRADVENPLIVTNVAGLDQRMLRANTFGTARIQIRENLAARVVPQECVQNDTDEELLFVRSGDHSFQAVPVELGVSDGEFVEVLSDFGPDVVVARKGSHVIKSQMVLNRLEAGE